MSEWKEYTLGDFIKIKHGFAFKGDFISTDDNGVVLVTPGNFAIGGGFQERKCKFFTDDYPEDYVLNAGDLIVTMTDLSKDGDTLGYSAKVPESRERIYLHNQRIGLIQFICDDVVDRDFLYWFMRTPSYQKGIVATSSGSTVKHTSPGRICESKILLPPLAEQKRIAGILSSLDDKIELNNAINKNLEQQAQTLFKSWFIDYDPFGGSMPPDWKRGKLSDIAEFEKEKIDISELSVDTYYSTENMLPNKAGVLVAANLPSIEQTTQCFPGETIISNIRPYFKKIFYCTEEIAGCSTDVLCFKPKKPSLSVYNYCLLFSDAFFEYMMKGSKGTKMPRGDKSQIMNYEVPVPSEECLKKFDAIVSPMQEQIKTNREETQRLTTLRGTLLTKLLS